MNNSLKIRKNILSKVDKVVIKVGTRLLVDDSFTKNLVAQIAYLRNKGINVILVSSGAVGTGMNILKITKRPSRLSDIQALAAIGQSYLMSQYNKYCTKYGFHAAQLLLTADDLRNRERHVNIMNCINSLWANGNLPIINEDDSVSVDELKVGDNDTLAAFVAVMTRTSLTILLTTVDGLYTRLNGQLHERISIVNSISETMKVDAMGTDDSAMSVGGMITKLTAAEMVTSAGDSLIIADGRKDNILKQIFNYNDTGTLFVSMLGKNISARKRWLTFFSRSCGKILVDSGAKNAIMNSGCSLLPSGINSIEGSFTRGDTVKICNHSGKPFAKGLSNYSNSELNKIIGCNTGDISGILGAGDDEVIHRNNLVLI